MELKDKVVLVTGGTKGLGLSISKLLVKSGCIVYAISSSENSVIAAKEEVNHTNFNTIKCDVTEYEAIERVVAGIKRIDILINNAGVWLEGKTEENSWDDISRVIDVNLKGVIYTTKAVLPGMLKNGSGFIINVSSTSGLKGRENQATYAASKWGVTGFTESLKEDLKDTDIKVTGFYPGGMNTRLFAQAGFPKDNSSWMNTDKVAAVVKFILELDETMVLDHVVLNKRKKH